MSFHRFVRAGVGLVLGLAAIAAHASVTYSPSWFSGGIFSYGTSANAGGLLGSHEIAGLEYFVGTGKGAGISGASGMLAVDHPATGSDDDYAIAINWDSSAGNGWTAYSELTVGLRATVWATYLSYDVLNASALLQSHPLGDPTGYGLPPGAWNPGSFLGTFATGCTDFDALNVLWVVSAGGSLCLDQDVAWQLSPMTGQLRAQHGAYDLLLPFSIGIDGETVVHFDAPAPGVWDFSLADLDMGATMASDVYVNACGVVDVIFLDPYHFGCSYVGAYSTPQKNLDYTASYGAVSFSADLSGGSNPMPEPPALALVGLALLVAGARRAAKG